MKVLWQRPSYEDIREYWMKVLRQGASCEDILDKGSAARGEL